MAIRSSVLFRDVYFLLVTRLIGSIGQSDWVNWTFGSGSIGFVPLWPTKIWNLILVTLKANRKEGEKEAPGKREREREREREKERERERERETERGRRGEGWVREWVRVKGIFSKWKLNEYNDFLIVRSHCFYEVTLWRVFIQYLHWKQSRHDFHNMM